MTDFIYGFLTGVFTSVIAAAIFCVRMYLAEQRKAQYAGKANKSDVRP